MTPTQIGQLVENLMARIEAREPMCANCQHPINVSLDSHVCTEEAREVLG